MVLGIISMNNKNSQMMSLDKISLILVLNKNNRILVLNKISRILVLNKISRILVLNKISGMLVMIKTRFSKILEDKGTMMLTHFIDKIVYIIKVFSMMKN